MGLTYLIIDDEPLAHRVIEKYAQDIPFLQKKANAFDALEAATVLGREKVDLLFLDIHMPKIKGLDFLRSLPQPPQVIITSAYGEYALEGYELNVLDYLLKPFSFERFFQAVQKAQFRNEGLGSLPTSKRIFVKSDKKHLQLQLDQIDFVEAYGSYIKIYGPPKMVLVKERISAFAEKLPTDRFLRVHKSFLVALAKIQAIEGNRLWIGENEIPIGATFRERVRNLLEV